MKKVVHSTSDFLHEMKDIVQFYYKSWYCRQCFDKWNKELKVVNVTYGKIWTIVPSLATKNKVEENMLLQYCVSASTRENLLTLE